MDTRSEVKETGRQGSGSSPGAKPCWIRAEAEGTLGDLGSPLLEGC